VPRLNWGAPGARTFEVGIDRGVLYVDDQPGVVWNGLSSVNESPSGGDAQPFYLDGVKYINVSSSEEFQATIEAYTYPDEFEPCEGNLSFFNGLFVTQQPRASFGLAYRTKIGNDIAGADLAYKIHLIYNALAAPADRTNKSIAASTDLSAFSWTITTRPPAIDGFKRTSHFIIDSRYTNPLALDAIESVLYGDDDDTARLPSVEELLNIFTVNSEFSVVDNMDGSFTATGPDDIVTQIDSTTWEISTPAVRFLGDDLYEIITQ
jgi:hypothetical protein